MHSSLRNQPRISKNWAQIGSWIRKKVSSRSEEKSASQVEDLTSFPGEMKNKFCNVTVTPSAQEKVTSKKLFSISIKESNEGCNVVRAQSSRTLNPGLEIGRWPRTVLTAPESLWIWTSESYDSENLYFKIPFTLCGCAASCPCWFTTGKIGAIA